MDNIITYLYILFIIAASGCHIIEDPEKLPMYLKVDDVEVSYARPSETGRGLVNTPDVWISVNEEQHGVYHLPNVFPFVPDEKQQVKISARPGIRINGISATRGAYPFYTSWDTTIDVSLKDTVSIHPRSTYADNVIIPWVVDFESAGNASILDQAPNSNIELERVLFSDDESEGHPEQGNYFGKAVLNDPQDLMYLIIPSSRFLKNNMDGSPYFLEMDYDCTAMFEVNIRYTSPDGIFDETRIMRINPTRSADEPVRWNKIYINFSDRILEPQINVDEFAFSILSTNHPDSEVSYPAEFRFDNLKFVTR